MLVWSILMLVFAGLRGVRHDYVAYVQQWSLVMGGQNPWAGDNTYGPLHNVLAYFTAPTPLGPKYVMAAAFLLVNLMLVSALLRTAQGVAPMLAYGVIVPSNFLVIQVVASFGLNDTLAAACVGGAVLARFRRRYWLVGLLLGAGVLLKYYPALLLPFFCLDDGQFELKPLASATVTVVLGFLVAFATWGGGVVASLTAGVARDPKLLSVLSAIQHHPELGGQAAAVDFLIRTNAAFVIAGCVAVFVLAWAKRWSWIEASALAGLVYLMIYKVGHQQFYLPWLLLLVGLLILGTPRSKWLAYCCMPVVVFLSLFAFGYEVLTDGYWQTGAIVRANVGFFAFSLEVATILFFLATANLRGARAKAPRTRSLLEELHAVDPRHVVFHDDEVPRLLRP
jgi:hypothetical protein